MRYWRRIEKSQQDRKILSRECLLHDIREGKLENLKGIVRIRMQQIDDMIANIKPVKDKLINRAGYSEEA